MNTAAITTEYQPRTIQICELRESPDNPRQTFDKTALDQNAASIKAEGIQVPLIVRVLDGKAGY